MQQSGNTSKYLQRYAEPGTAALYNQLFSRSSETPAYRFCLCLPVYDENPQILQRLQALAKHQARCLFIVVVNQPNTVAQASRANTQFVTAINNQLPVLATAPGASLYAIDKHSGLLLLDRCTPGRQIDPRQGVGRARKIAADLALQLIYGHRVLQPFIFCSDADAHWPDDYFIAVQQSAAAHSPKTAAWIYPFKHIASPAQDSSPALHDATLLYEKRLNAYVHGLNYAGSPYAYHTLGSTICIAAEHYAMVRGFPCRNAGEDFYILNKLRKTGSIVSLAQPLIYLDARASSRTPFGTGSAAQQLAATNGSEPACFYHPALFFLLRLLLQWQDALAVAMQRDTALPWAEHLAHFVAAQLDHQSPARCDLTQRFTAAQLSDAMTAALEALDFASGLQHCQRQAMSAEAFAKHLYCWFDGFKTLKWLHQLRDGKLALHNLQLESMQREWQRLP
ncbi:MAG: hypothetical protein KJO24_01565, partial [Gammaproteobacteria bacterium]|nr:hypothetical protein [Gammaproteobacteria bacterium]